MKYFFVAERTHVLKYLVEVQQCVQGSLAFQQTKFFEKKNPNKQFEIKVINKPKRLVLKSLVMPTTRQRNSERRERGGEDCWDWEEGRQALKVYSFSSFLFFANSK